MRVLLVDDHVLFREGLVLLMRPQVDGLEVLEAGSCEEAQALLAQVNGAVDLVLMDLGLPGMSGLDGMVWLKQTYPEVPVVALSSADDRATVMRALDAGAMGFIPKSSSSAVMMGAVRLVMAKGLYLPPSVFLAGHTGPAGLPVPPPSSPFRAAHELPLAATVAAAAPAFAPAPATAPASASAVAQPAAGKTRSPEDLGLTPRQIDVLDLILQGKSAKVICRDLAPGTVKTHTSAVLRALNVTTRTQAVIAAAQLGWRLSR